MNTAIKTAAAGLLLSALTISAASAMIPKPDLTKNQFPDEGISAQVLSDIDNGVLNHNTGAHSRGLSELNLATEPLTHYQQKLGASHWI